MANVIRSNSQDCLRRHELEDFEHRSDMEVVGANFRREVLVEEPNVTKGDYDYAQVSNKDE